MKFLKKKKIFLVSVISALLLTSCGFGKVEVVFDENVAEDMESVEEVESNYNIFIRETELEENAYDLNVQVKNLATTEVIGEYDKESTFVTCEITAPDVYSYLMNNIDVLNELDTEQLYQNVMEYIKSEECPKRIVKVDVPAAYRDGKLIIDTTSIEYQDAVNGGMNSALTEIYLLWLTEIGNEVE